MLFFHPKPHPTYTFKPNDAVVWNDENQVGSGLIAKYTKYLGPGPFTVLRVTNVPPQDLHGTQHPQFLMIKELIGKKYLDSEIGMTITCEGTWSGLYFKPVGAP